MSGIPPMRARTPRPPGAAWRSFARRACACACAAALALGLYAAPVRAVSPQDHPALARFIDDMVARHGFARAELERLFAAVERRPQIVAAMERPREALPWHEYRRGFVNEERARLGVRFWRENRETLARAESRYGVPAEVIVAILGVETRYGAHTGSHKVLDALVTLMLDYPRRAEFFRRELEEFLLLARELALDPLAVKGSYAGALGIPQFIASSYREYAVDFDRDGRRDLFRSRADAIGSVAHFLQRHGWAAGQPVIERVRVATAPAAPTGYDTVRTLREWMDEGIAPSHPPEPAAVERTAALIALEGESETLYHLGYNNFYVITRYNRSQNYAMAVYELARMIRALAEEP
ncbi:MAG TPA: lytic murein transglycosylase B [Burkholderiales bacterium]